MWLPAEAELWCNTAADSWVLLHGNTVLGNCLCFPNGVKFQIQMQILVMPTVFQALTEPPAPAP